MPKILAESYSDTIVIDFICSAIKDEVEVREASDLFDHHLETSSKRNMLIDLSRVNYVTSSMIGALVKLKKKCDVKKVKLKLCGVSGELEEVFKVTKMHKLFKIYDNRAKALGRSKKGGVVDRRK